MLTATKVKPWMRPRYLEWRKEYERSEKFLAKVRVRQRKYRADPAKKEKFVEYQHRYKSKHKIRHLVGLAIRRAKAKGILCDKPYLLSLEEQRPINCPCCGHLLDYSANGHGSNRAPERAPSLDRIDRERGYVAGNVAILCWRCNRLKSDSSIQELDALLRYMRSHQ